MAQVRLNIADIVLALEFADPAVAGLVGDFYRGFVTEAEPEGILRVEWEGPANLTRIALDIVPQPHGRIEAGVLEASWELFRGHYDFVRGSGHCQVRGILGLERFMWLLMSTILPSRDGLAVHAASVSDGLQAFIFPAPSGTGKSTLVRNSPGHRTLSDDGSLLRIVNGRLLAFGSPFRSDNYADLAGGAVPVTGLYFLEQSPYDCLLPITPAEAMTRWMSQAFIFCPDPGLRLQVFDVSERVIRQTKTYVLQLTNSGRFWGCISDELADQGRTGVPAPWR